CAYCGRTADQWDHLYALVMNKKPTGYITEINNLVPSCGACNQRKRGTNWKDFVNHPGKNFPKTFRDGFRKRLAALEKYARLRRQKIDFEKWEGDPAYSDYWKRHRAVIKALRAAQTTATHLRTKLLDTVPSKRRQ
ncbi:MAG TPA: hypothetical protein PKC35_12910, partial [Leptospiraceae bacterium]|nr:hypothetical protein [Leptospiraceae bacterium]